MKKLRTPSNPFLISGYHSPGYFCDREKELAWLLEQISQERNTVLYADRRIGKTALLNHLIYKLEKEKTADTLFVDLLATTDFQSANQKITEAIFKKFNRKGQGIGSKMLRMLSSVGATVTFDSMSGLPKITFGAQNPVAPTQTLEGIGEYLKSHSKPVVICLDEFQAIVNYPGMEAEALFRTWTQQYPMVRFVFSGSHKTVINAMFTQKARPFFNSAQLLSLNSIAEDEYIRFAKGHFKAAKKSIDEELIRKAIDWSKGQTYYVQLVLNKLFASETTDSLTLQHIFHEIIEEKKHTLAVYQSLMTTFQWKVLQAIAKEEAIANPMSKDFIQRHALGTPSSVSTALKKLMSINMVVKYQTYRVDDIALMRWLQTF